MFIFAPDLSLGPTSWNNNGCQVESGRERIKLSPPLPCVNLLLQTFSYLIHFHPLRCRCTKFSGSAGPSGPGAWIPGTGKWLSSQHTAQVWPSEGTAELAPGAGNRPPFPAHTTARGRCLGVTPKPKKGLFSKQERKLWCCWWSQC